MSEAVIAYRYAKALIDFAIEQNVLEEVNEDMSFFTEISKNNPEFIKVMSNPIVRHDKKLSILKNIFEKNVNKVTYSIFNVLTKKNRESLILPIAKEFQILYRSKKGIQVASITTVSALTSEQRSVFEKIVSDATGKKVDLQERVDESLIGGYLLQVDDTQIDTSIKKSLTNLKLSLA